MTTMQHLSPYQKREIRFLGVKEWQGWRLKQYAILADQRELDQQAVISATQAAFDRLPKAGFLEDPNDNQAVGFQILHFARDIPLVSPVFYWTWGSVLSKVPQMRSYTKDPYTIVDGMREVVGCVWEMELIAFEVSAWRESVLGSEEDPVAKIKTYLNRVPDDVL